MSAKVIDIGEWKKKHLPKEQQPEKPVVEDPYATLGVFKMLNGIEIRDENDPRNPDRHA